jgi:hypothetical protein
LKSFGDFTASDFGSWKKMCRTYGRATQNGQPYLCYFDGKDSDSGHHDPNTATVLIPSLHPGFLSRAGIVKEKATRVFVLTSAVAWCAMSAALVIARDGIPDNREQYAKMIMTKVESVAGPHTLFGKAIAVARKEYDDCHQAYSEGQVKRRNAPTLQIPKGVLPKKSFRAKKKSRYTTSVGHSGDGVGGWEVAISKTTDVGAPPDFYTISWNDDEGERQVIGPIPLSKDILPPDANAKRFIFL